MFRKLVPEDLEERLREGIASAMRAGACGAEAFVTVSRSSRAKVQDGVLQDLSTSKRGGLGARVLRRGKSGIQTGIATTTDLSRPSFETLFRQAWELSALGDEDPWVSQAGPAGVDDLPPRYDPRVETLGPSDRIQRAQELEAEARRASGRVAAVRESTWSDGIGASLLLTDKGVRVADLGSSCSGSIELAVEREGDRQAGWHWEMGRHPGAFSLAAIGREATLKAERKLKPSRLPAGRYRVVLHPEVTVDLLGIIAGMLEGESILRGRSLFAGKLGQRIGSPLLTLVDDGRLPHGLASEPWDGEGVPTRRNLLIEEGVLASHLHTLRSAAEMGSEPTASASRGPGSNPRAATHNLHPLAGRSKVEELFRDAGDGVLLTEIMGLHTVDPVSGDLSVGASGLRIRGGSLAEPVDRLTFAGNLRDFLTRIMAIGDDLRWYGGSGGLSMLLDDIALGGI
ncbi:MAG: TldD/PmbA family protein [Acidobacteria bacterium]|nr:TldD/PmbA family protein [Acidobacteriota bacterium]